MKKSILIPLLAMFAANLSWAERPGDLVTPQPAPEAGKTVGRPGPIPTRVKSAEEIAQSKSAEEIAQRQIQILESLVRRLTSNPDVDFPVIDIDNVFDATDSGESGSQLQGGDEDLLMDFGWATHDQEEFNKKFAGHENAVKAGTVLDNSAKYQEVYKRYIALVQEVLEMTEDAKPDDVFGFGWELRQECLKFHKLLQNSPVWEGAQN